MKKYESANERTRIDTPGGRAGRAAYRRKWYPLFQLILVIGYNALIKYEERSGIISISRVNGYTFLLFGTAIALGNLLMAWSRWSKNRARKKGAEFFCDYIRSLYLRLLRHRWLTTPAAFNRLLLAQAKLNIVLDQPGEALLDLNEVTQEKLSKEQLKTFYFYQASAAFLTGNEELCERALVCCQGILADCPGYLTDEEVHILFEKDVTQEESELLFRSDAAQDASDITAEEMLPESESDESSDSSDHGRKTELQRSAEIADAVRNWYDTYDQPAHPFGWFLAGLLAGYIGVYYGILHLLPSGYTYRTMFASISIVLMDWGLAALVLAVIYKLFRWAWSRWQAVLQRIGIALAALLVLMVPLGLFAGSMLQIMMLDTEEDLGNGLLLVTDAGYSSSERYSYYYAHGPFLRSYYKSASGTSGSYGSSLETMEPDETQEADALQAADETQLTEEAQVMDEIQKENDTQNADASQETDSEEIAEESGIAEENIEPTEVDVEAAHWARREENLRLVAQFLADTGEMSVEAPAALEMSYNAKGNLYAVVWTAPYEEDTSLNAQGRLVYDRVSANKACDLYVYYEDILGEDGVNADYTFILNFYAVNMETGEVIPADKDTWGGLATEEYQEATGE